MWLYLFIKKYLLEDYGIDFTPTKIKSIMEQMLKEGYLTKDLITRANEHEVGENKALHEIVDKIATFVDSDNYKLHPSTIKVTRETKDRLDALKSHPRESYNEVILRILNEEEL